MNDDHLKLECMKLVAVQFRESITCPEDLVEMASKLYAFAVGKPIVAALYSASGKPKAS